MKRGGRLPRQSAKRRAEAPARRAVIEEVTRRAGGRCAAREVVPESLCWGPFDVDEIVSRAQRPGGHLDVDNCQLLCRAHHDWKHSFPIEAAKRGLRPFPKGYMGED